MRHLKAGRRYIPVSITCIIVSPHGIETRQVDDLFLPPLIFRRLASFSIDLGVRQKRRGSRRAQGVQQDTRKYLGAMGVEGGREYVTFAVTNCKISRFHFFQLFLYVTESQKNVKAWL